MDSPLGDVEYKASSTNMKNIIKYLFKNKEIQNKKYNALKFKNNIMSEKNN